MAFALTYTNLSPDEPNSAMLQEEFGDISEELNVCYAIRQRVSLPL
jgi:hypothetical protein